MENNERKTKNSEARIRANNKYKKANYKQIKIEIRPEQAEAIRETAKQFNISIAQLIINSVNEYKTNHGSGADTAQPEQDPTKSPMESGETAGAQPEEETTEEEEEEEDIPEELKAVRAAWARMGAFNEKITAERKRREAEERERRREITDEERYMMR